MDSNDLKLAFRNDEVFYDTIANDLNTNISIQLYDFNKVISYRHLPKEASKKLKTWVSKRSIG